MSHEFEGALKVVGIAPEIFYNLSTGKAGALKAAIYAPEGRTHKQEQIIVTTRQKSDAWRRRRANVGIADGVAAHTSNGQTYFRGGIGQPRQGRR